MSTMGTVTVTASVTPIVATNTARRALFLKSMKTNTATVFLKLDNGATVLTAANGSPLEPGESLTLINNRFSGPVGVPSNGVEYWCAISGITSASSCDIRFSEIV